MGNFDRNNNSGGGRFGRGGFGGGQDGPRQMHDAICSECGKNCQIPFRPSGDRPVFCSDCFAKNTGKEPRRSFGGGDRRDDRGGSRPFRQSDGDSDGKSLRKMQFEALEAKLDKILAMLSANNTVVETQPVKAEKKSKVAVVEPQVDTFEEVVITEPEVKAKPAAKKKKSAKKVS